MPGLHGGGEHRAPVAAQPTRAARQGSNPRGRRVPSPSWRSSSTSTAPSPRLCVAHMQLVEIAKALATDGQVLLLDEQPHPHRRRGRPPVCRRARVARPGRVVVLVSHKLEEVFAVATASPCCATAAASPSPADGRPDTCDNDAGPAPTSSSMPETLITKAFTCSWRPSRRRSATVTSPSRCIVARSWGSASWVQGAVSWSAPCWDSTRSQRRRCRSGRAVSISSVGDALRRHRIGYVTENRKEEGVFLDQTVSRNVSVTVWDRLARWGLVRDRVEDDLLSTYRERLGMRVLVHGTRRPLRRRPAGR